MESANNKNTYLWNLFKDVPQEYTYPFMLDGKEMTGIKPVYGRLKMTEFFGPVGTGWGYRSKVLSDKNNLIMEVTLWYKPHLLDNSYSESDIAEVTEYGGTLYFRDDSDVYKKTLTDGLSRCFMALGCGASLYTEPSKYASNQHLHQPDGGEGDNLPFAEETTSEPNQGVPSAHKVQLESWEKIAVKLKEKDPYLSVCQTTYGKGIIFFSIEKETIDDIQPWLDEGFKQSPSKPDIIFKAFAFNEGGAPHQ